MPFISKKPGILFTDRLRLEPITVQHARDYFLVFQDDGIAEWYAGKPAYEEAVRNVEQAERLWNSNGFGKWLLYEQGSDTVVGRGGLSAMHLDAYNGAICSLLPQGPWVHESIEQTNAHPLARRWAEIGWALRREYWGRGYATEIGRFGIRFAFEELDLRAVVSFTERHNLQSRRVMERIGMRYAGEFLGSGLIEGKSGVHEVAPFSLYVALREH